MRKRYGKSKRSKFGRRRMSKSVSRSRRNRRRYSSKRRNSKSRSTNRIAKEAVKTEWRMATGVANLGTALGGFTGTATDITDLSIYTGGMFGTSGSLSLNGDAVVLRKMYWEGRIEMGSEFDGGTVSEVHFIRAVPGWRGNVPNFQNDAYAIGNERLVWDPRKWTVLKRVRLLVPYYLKSAAPHSVGGGYSLIDRNFTGQKTFRFSYDFGNMRRYYSSGGSPNSQNDSIFIVFITNNSTADTENPVVHYTGTISYYDGLQ